MDPCLRQYYFDIPCRVVTIPHAMTAAGRRILGPNFLRADDQKEIMQLFRLEVTFSTRLNGSSMSMYGLQGICEL